MDSIWGPICQRSLANWSLYPDFLRSGLKSEGRAGGGDYLAARWIGPAIRPDPTLSGSLRKDGSTAKTRVSARPRGPPSPSPTAQEKVAKSGAVYIDKLHEVAKGHAQTWTKLLDKALRVEDVARWLSSMLDSERRQVADAALSAIASVSERLKHDDVVRAWIEEHERGDAVEGQ